MKTAAKWILFSLIGFLTLSVTVWYGGIILPIAGWTVIWLLSFLALLFWNGSLHQRGAVFALLSLIIALVGQKVLENLYGDLFVIELMAQLFIVIGAAIGANLVSDWLIKIEQVPKAKKPCKKS